MRKGEFPDGAMTLRAKIDLASGNFNMRDPAIYRIKHMHHHRTGDQWCIYPMYDFAHPIEDALEGITHSLCSLEFESHRPLYDWVVNNISIPYHKPRQIEFARLGIDHTVMSKRKLRQLVETELCLRLGRSPDAHHLRPAPPGLHPRRHPRTSPSSIGVAKADSTVEYAFLEHCLRAGSGRHRRAGHGRHPAHQADHHQLSRGSERDLRDREPPQTPGDGHPTPSPSPGSSISRRRTSLRPRSPSTSACIPTALSAA